MDRSPPQIPFFCARHLEAGAGGVAASEDGILFFAEAPVCPLASDRSGTGCAAVLPDGEPPIYGLSFMTTILG